MMRMNLDGSGTSSFQPLLGQLPPERIHPAAAFVDWWNDPVLTDADGTTYGRRSLVRSVANKEGGAHVDEALPPAYAALTRENSIGITQVAVSQPNRAGLGSGIASTATGIPRESVSGQPLENSLVLANVRQIAWELRDTIRRHLVIAAPVVYVRSPVCPLSINENARADRRGHCPCGSEAADERNPRSSQAAVPTQYLSAKPARFWSKRDWTLTIGITPAKHRRDGIRVIGTSP